MRCARSRCSKKEPGHQSALNRVNHLSGSEH
jgi:hypothetical protein